MIIIILKYLNFTIPDGSEFIISYSFNVFILLIVLFLSILNLLAYLSSLILINKYELVNKYPKLKRIINLYEKTSIFFIILELVFVFGVIIFLMLYSYFVFNKYLI